MSVTKTGISAWEVTGEQKGRLLGLKEYLRKEGGAGLLGRRCTRKEDA